MKTRPRTLYTDRIPTALVALSLLALTALVLSLLAGCDPGPGPGDATADTPAQSYSTRGVVRALPSAPGTEVQIRHEALPDFVSIDGEVVGMKSMTMPFPADAAMLEGVEVGDKVSFDFEVRWTGSPPMKVTRLELLPPETVLDFETPAEPTGEVGDAAAEEAAAEEHAGHEMDG